MEETILLWVYGTLKRRGRLHGAMHGAAFIGCCRTMPGYRLLNLGIYPGLVRIPSSSEADRVSGELFSVPVSILEHLDEVEGAPGLFSREPVGLDHARGVAQAYFHQGSRTGFPSVPGGEWPVP